MSSNVPDAVAAHDAPVDGSKRAVGHLFTLNLRNHAMAHLIASDQKARKHEHEMRAGAGKGRKVIYAYDRACIDFRGV